MIFDYFFFILYNRLIKSDKVLQILQVQVIGYMNKLGTK